VVRVSLSTDVYARGRRVHTLTVCPCGYVFAGNENRWKHFLEDHQPEDFGLSRLGERAASLAGSSRVVATDGGEHGDE